MIPSDVQLQCRLQSTYGFHGTKCVKCGALDVGRVTQGKGLGQQRSCASLIAAHFFRLICFYPNLSNYGIRLYVRNCSHATSFFLFKVFEI